MKDYSQAFINTNGEEFPNTKAVDAGSQGNTNGTEIIADLLNDNWGFSQVLLKAASINPNGEDESADNSQKLEAIKKLYNDADTALKNILTQTITQADNAVIKQTLLYRIILIQKKLRELKQILLYRIILILKKLELLKR